MSTATKQNVPEPRSRRIDTRFSEAELALVEKVAGWRKLPASAYVRGAALSAAVQAQGHGHEGDVAVQSAQSLLSAEQISVLDGMRIDVKRIGVNLNQLSRLGHQGVLDLGALSSVVDDLVLLNLQMVEVLGEKGRA